MLDNKYEGTFARLKSVFVHQTKEVMDKQPDLNNERYLQ